ncbi:hypothetical protein CHGG_08121 [Chaetomium globosum CBS 148.51]|uniref:Acid phosphatase n=1 Tax=Chaetomium globosum (strain ATCC 6205 / CBS 148.51 / DSM 1962 / NBRC 6347 / NRRL 1970) TaxID=306901 RepID=Q2GV83_CHAGB|nr:uncharacterized protein CHGG_08121 [Chaetomium globosum CBS 148.51]EAQ86868.1 hypothetical protein CHGG_08121 [Chaetomium globosum CBS 148.51]
MQRFISSLLLVAYVGIVSGAAELTRGKVFDRFITIWLENQDYAKVVVDSSIADLKRQGILLTRYYAHTHPSQPELLRCHPPATTSATITTTGFRLPENVATVVDLARRTRTWDYVRKHNPFVTYDSVTNQGERLLRLESFDDFQRAFAAKQVPQFVFMTPNMMNDGHNTTLDFATKWSHKFLQPLLADKAFNERTLISLTYDESETYTEPNHIVTLLLGSAIPPALKGSQDDTFYTHYSMLSTLQANWGLHNLGRYDVGANVFKLVADKVGYTANKDPENLPTNRFRKGQLPPETMPHDGASSGAVAEPMVVDAGAAGLEQSRHHALANLSDKPPTAPRNNDETAATQVRTGEDIYEEKIRHFVVKVTKTNNYWAGEAERVPAGGRAGK